MITCYILIKLMGLLVRLCLWMVLLPIKLIFLPFSLLFGKSSKQINNSDDGFWDGLVIGSLFSNMCIFGGR